MPGALQHRRIALAEARELDLLAGLLEREGATVVRCPLIAITDVPDAVPVEGWIRRVIAGSCDDIVFYTGEGVRRLLGFAERAGLGAAFLAALGRARKITRGPKPVRALREVGLSPDLTADIPTTDGLIALLDKGEIKGRTIGLQIYGQEPNQKILDFLADRGAVVDVVAPYVYASEADDTQVQACIRQLADGKIDAIAFTSAAQIQRLEDVANKAGLTEALKRGLDRSKVAAIGPVMAAELQRRGIRADAMPQTAFTMKPLVKAIARMFAPDPAEAK